MKNPPNRAIFALSILFARQDKIKVNLNNISQINIHHELINLDLISFLDLHYSKRSNNNQKSNQS
jgi:hypothetical protein